MTKPMMSITILLAAIAQAPAKAATDDAPAPRIVVGGNASVRTPPDLATIQFGARGEGATSDEAVRALVAKRAAIEAAIGAMRGAGQATASDVSVQEVRGRECQTYQPQLSVGACAILGYRATMEMALRTGLVGQAGTLVGAIGRAGGSNPRIASFQLADDAAPRARALAQAFAEARSRAEALATAGHVRLGRLLAASDGSAGGGAAEDEDMAPMTVPAPAPPPPPPPAPIAVTLKPAPVETQARVTVTYEVLP